MVLHVTMSLSITAINWISIADFIKQREEEKCGSYWPECKCTISPAITDSIISTIVCGQYATLSIFRDYQQRIGGLAPHCCSSSFANAIGWM